MITLLNECGAIAGRTGGLMFFQSAILVLLLVLVERGFGRRMRSSLRCALWLLVVLKLLLPPSLKFPTGVGFWLGRWFAAPIQAAPPARMTLTTLAVEPPIPFPDVPVPTTDAAMRPPLDFFGGMLLLWLAGSAGLAAWMVRRNRQVLQLVREAEAASPEFLEPLQDAAARLGLPKAPELRLTRSRHSPAVYGFLHPVVLLPGTLARRLTPEALRDVLLHELVHVRRRDLWLNLPQTVVQVIWWWNPVVWLANARIRALREQAVDEQVMLLRPDETTTYPATLVEVARHCLDRPALALSFVGILESRRDLRSRVERLLNSPLPRRAGLGWSGWIAVGAAALLALPMAMARRVETQTAVLPGAVNVIVLNVDAGDPPYRIEATRLTAGELPALFSEALQVNPNLSAVLNSARNAPWGSVVKAMDAIQSAGIKSVRAFTHGGGPGTADELATMDLEFARRYGLGPAGGSNAPTFMKRYGLVPSGQTNETTAAMDPVMARRYGLAAGPATQREGEGADANSERVASAGKAIPNRGQEEVPDQRTVYIDPNTGNLTPTLEEVSSPKLYTRTFRVNANTLLQGVGAVTGTTLSHSSPGEIQSAIKDFFRACGVDFPGPGHPPSNASPEADQRALFFNDRTGILLVRATLFDLDTVEKAIQALNVAVAQVVIEASFVEVADRWDLGTLLDLLSVQHVNRVEGESGALSGIITEAQLAGTLHALESLSGVTLVAAPRVTTLSDRQVQVSVSELPPVSLVDPKSGVTNQISIGPVLDVLPTVQADDVRIHLKLVTTLNRLLGYSSALRPTPIVSQASHSTQATVRDGQTLVLANEFAEDQSGRTGTGPSGAANPADQKPKRLLVFVTPVIIDPAGFRVHPPAKTEAAPGSTPAKP